MKRAVIRLLVAVFGLVAGVLGLTAGLLELAARALQAMTRAVAWLAGAMKSPAKAPRAPETAPKPAEKAGEGPKEEQLTHALVGMGFRAPAVRAFAATVRPRVVAGEPLEGLIKEGIAKLCS
jgi:hypothetical protein